MSREIVLISMVVLAAVLIGLGVWAWRRRARRDAGLPAPVGEIPAGARTLAVFTGFYVATTSHDQPLERLAIAGLGFRSRMTASVTDAGIALDLTGQSRLFIPTAQIVAVDRATVAIDRVVEKEGLVRLTWRSGTVPVDTYLRAQDASSLSFANTVAGILPTTHATPTGTDA